MIPSRMLILLCASAACAAAAAAQTQKPALAQREDIVRAVPEGKVTLDIVLPQAANRLAKPLSAGDFKIYDNGKPVSDFQLADAADSQADGVTKIMFAIDALSMDPIDIERSKQAVGAWLRRDGGRLRHPVSIVSLEKNIGKAERARASMVKRLGGKSGYLRLIPYSLDGNALNTALQKENIFSAPLLDVQGGEGGAVRMSLSLEAVGLVGDAESSVPGHKLLIWISPGWPVPSGGGVRDQASLQSEVAFMSGALQMGRIAMYSVNPSLSTFNGGATPIAGSGAGTGPNPSVYTAGPEGGPVGIVAPSSTTAAGKSLSFGDISLPSIVARSGGFAFGPGGDINSEIAQCVADADRIASVTYTPVPAVKTNTGHTVSVAIAGVPGRARTISGFFLQPVAGDSGAASVQASSKLQTK